MRDILVFFKSLEAERLSDPGPRLKLVLDFKKKLEQERQLLFHQFRVSLETLRIGSALSSHRGIRQHERDQNPVAELAGTPRRAPPADEVAVDQDPLDQRRLWRKRVCSPRPKRSTPS